MGESQRAVRRRVQRSVDGSWSTSDGRPLDTVRFPLALYKRNCRQPPPNAPSLSDRIGRLTVSGYLLAQWSGELARVLVKCSCGAAEHPVFLQSLQQGKTKSCVKCGWRSAGAAKAGSYGYREVTQNPELARNLAGRVSDIYRRCLDPKHRQYKHYGGRGIGVYAPWLEGVAEDIAENSRRRSESGPRTRMRNRPAGKVAFLQYLVSLPGCDDFTLQLDRIENNRGYEPGNLRFATRTENINNRRTIEQLQKELDYYKSLRSTEQRS